MANQLAIDSRVRLNDGTEIPQLGLGVYLSRGAEGVNAVSTAIKLGYRHIDSARWYGNEREVAQGVKESGVPRDQLWITSKVWDDEHDKCMDAVKSSVERLGGPIDLMLLHSPNPGKEARLKAYGDLVAAKKQGLIRSHGVSNFGVHHIEELLAAYPNDPPSVNQIEISPFFQRKEIVNACLKHKIALQAYSPLGKGAHVDLPELKSIASKYGKTPSQLLIRWSLQTGHICLPKSANPQRIKENADIFDFVISEDDVRALDAMETGSGITWDPTKAP